MKKIFLLIVIVLSTSSIFISCNNNLIKDNLPTENSPTENNSDVEEVEEKIYTTFKALDKTYSSTKNISDLDYGTIIYDSQINNPYIPLEYKEVDFSYDLLKLYLNEDKSIFNNLVSFDVTSKDKITIITEEDKNDLLENLQDLRNQMTLSSSEEMVVTLDKVIYEGVSDTTGTGIMLKIRVAISKPSDYSAAWNYFTLTIYEREDTLYCNLF